MQRKEGESSFNSQDTLKQAEHLWEVDGRHRRQHWSDTRRPVKPEETGVCCASAFSTSVNKNLSSNCFSHRPKYEENRPEAARHF